MSKQKEEYSNQDANESVDCNGSMSDEELNKRISEGIEEPEDVQRSNPSKEVDLSDTTFRNSQRESYKEIDGEFKIFLHNFVEIENEKGNQKLHLKDQFFWFIMIGFFILISTPCLLILNIHNMSEANSIVALISVLIELVSAIMVLPKIIAEYLFNKEEDAHMMEIIKSMQEYNEKKHTHIDKKDD